MGTGEDGRQISLEVLRRRLRQEAQWHGPEADPTLTTYQAVCDHPAGPGGDAARRVADGDLERGLQQRRLLDDLYRIAARRGAQDPRVTDALAEAIAQVTWWPGFPDRARKRVAHGDAAHARKQSERRHPAGNVVPGTHDHQIQALAPARRWTLLIDETGDVPSETTVIPSPDQPARFVGLLVPEGCPLPPLPARWHAMEQRETTAIDAVVQHVLDAPVGVFGIALAALPPGRQEAWSAGVMAVIRWTCRLLTIDGPTDVSVQIEQRGSHQSGTAWTVAADELVAQGLQADPERYRQLKLSVRLIAKEDHPYNGYVDALAFTWGSTSSSSRRRLLLSRLAGSCLHEGDSEAWNAMWAALHGGRLPAPAQWRLLLEQAAAGQPDQLARLLIGRMQERCRSDRGLWRDMLSQARRHLDSKAVHLPGLGREMGFLVSCQPADETLSEPLRLAWLTVQLEHVNHLGQVDRDLDREVAELGDRLWMEAPTLACQADLDRAVQATNRFDWDTAGRILDRWWNQPPALPGLRHGGRVRSALGQYAAFCGDPVAALQEFDKAIVTFRQLSDPAQAEAELAQTRTYRAIVLMDWPKADADVLRAAVQEVVSLAPVDIAAMAGSGRPSDKYRHHLLLRHLVRHGSAAERSAYLGAQADWQHGYGHPWPLIHWYRGWLLLGTDAPQAAEDAMATAIETALMADQGPTVRFIGLALAAASRRLGVDLDAPDAGDLPERLPKAPWAALERFARGDGRARFWEDLGQVLPFNFC